MPVQRPYNPDAKRMAEMMQADLAKVGVKAKIVSYEWGEYRKRAQDGEHDMALLGWTGDNGDPDNFFVPLPAAPRPSGRRQRANWCDKDFDDLIEKAAQTGSRPSAPSSTSRRRWIMHEQAPFFLIAHSVTSCRCARRSVATR